MLFVIIQINVSHRRPRQIKATYIEGNISCQLSLEMSDSSQTSKYS